MIARALVAAVAAAALVAGCGEEATPGEGATLTIYVSLPLSGPAAADGRDAADGARLALADAGGEAAGYAVEAKVLDGSDGARRWTPSLAAANARTAIRDSTAVAYVGDFESGATRASLPITNGARMLQVSPASGATDLVAPVPGSDDVPDVQHTDERTFGRVIPSDYAQKSATAAWARELGVENEWSYPDAGRYGELVHRSGSFATSAALDPSHLPPAGEDFVERFEAEHNRPPGRYAAYGYEAMAVILDSIERATEPADRQAVVDAFFATSSRDSILGPYSISETGETTLGRMSGYEVRGGAAEPAAELDVP